MIPILYEANETAFTSNGLGRLSDAITCTVIEEANGVFELNMTYPLDGIHVKDLEANKIIYAKPAYDKNPQPFRIRELNRSWGNRIQIVARHFCYELSYYAVEEFGDSNSFPYNKDPILYSPSSVFIGVMDDTISFNVKKNQNKTKYLLTLYYPVNGKYSSQIVVNGHIFVQPEINKPTQTFYIKTVTTAHSKMTITADAPTDIQFSDGANVMDVVEALGRVSNYVIDPDFPFTFEVIPKSLESPWRYTEHEWWSEYPRSVRELIMDGDGMFIDTYGGEWEWDHYKCYFHEQRGVESGVIYTYGKNISDISAVTNIDEFYTHVISYWKGSVSSSTNVEKVDNDVTEYYCHRGSVIKAAPAEYDPIFPYKRTLIVDASSEFEEDPTTAQLDDYTNWYIKQNEVGIPRVTIKVDVVDLASTEEYKNYAKFETVHLCDYVTITFPMFGVDVKEQVSKVEFNVLTEKNNSITIGEPKITLADAIASNKYNIRKSKYDNQKWADKVAERATRASNGWYGGNIKKKYNSTDHKQQEMLIMDSDNEDSASHVLKADKDGISGSKEGSKGTYDAIIALHNPLGNVGVNATAVNFGTVKSQTQTKQSTWNLETGESTMFMNKTAVGASTTDADLAGNFVQVVNGLMKIVGKLGVGESITEQELSLLDMLVKGLSGVAGTLTIADTYNEISNIPSAELDEYNLYVKGKAKVTENLFIDDIDVKEKLDAIPDDLSGRMGGIDRSLDLVWDNIDWIWEAIQ